MQERLYRFWATTIAGLEQVALEDLRARLAGLEQVRIETGGRSGRLLFQYRRSPRRLLELRSVEKVRAVLAEIHGVTVGRPGLERLCTRLAGLDLGPALHLAGVVQEDVDKRRYQLSATVQGHHRFGPAQLVQAVEKVLKRSHGLEKGTGPQALKLHLQVEGRRALLGLHLPMRLRSRGGPDQVLMYCLGQMLGIQPADAVCCLEPSLAALQELASAHGPARLVACGGQARPGMGAGVFWVAGNQRCLPLAAGWAQVALKTRLEKAPNLQALAELARILQPGGMAVLPLVRPEGLIAALGAGRLPFEVVAGLPIYLKGRKCVLFLLERLGHPEEGTDLIQVEMDM